MKGIFAEAVTYDEKLRGRMGGNAPQSIESFIPEGYVFYATLVHPEKEDRMLSILIHQDFDILIDNNIYPNIEVKVIEHHYSDMSTNEKFSIKDLGLASITIYNENIKTKEDALFIQCYGEPRLIQNKNRYYNQLEKDGYAFFIQISEEGYNFDFMDVVFNFGGLYLYKHTITGEVIAGYWQYS